MSENTFVWAKHKKLESQGRELLAAKQYTEAEVVLLKALDTDDPITRHFVYNHLIELYYKLRDKRKDALDKCVLYCKADIDSLPRFLQAWEAQYGDKPHCPSIERLVIIHEKASEIHKSIDLCRHAIELGLEEMWDSYNSRYGTNKGYKVRIAKLEKKLRRQEEPEPRDEEN